MPDCSLYFEKVSTHLVEIWFSVGTCLPDKLSSHFVSYERYSGSGPDLCDFADC